MLTFLLALFIHGHHYGWQQPHNPHHRPPCSVAFHVGCAVIPTPPQQLPPGFHLPPPTLP